MKGQSISTLDIVMALHHKTDDDLQAIAEVVQLIRKKQRYVFLCGKKRVN